MTKYGPLGWITQAGVTAALLAETGYTGDIDLFQGDYGFGRYTGVLQWHPERILRGLEDGVPRLRLFFKFYPMGRILPGAIDNFLLLLEENHLKAEEIEKVTAKIHILGSFPCFTENRLQTQEDYCFNAGYALACTAHGIPPHHWHSDEARKNKEVAAFMEKVQIVFHEKEDGLAMIEDSQARPMWVEVKAGGKTYRRESSHIMGSFHPVEYRMSDERLKEKFRSQASYLLTPEYMERLEEAVFHLQDVDHIGRLMRWTVPQNGRDHG
jgi:2-methylcitrate dehydratase PrpD